jgi:acyl phosphate:glycerol-3-phosphate acyltransferase
MPENILPVIAVIAISYLMGSFPTAYIVARLKGVNIFEVGSGNMGGTNAIRALGTGWGILVLVIDILKGIIAILISRYVWQENQAAATTISAIAVIIGHNWSLFATLITGTLRGGKGAATAFGTILMIAPVHLILALCVIGGAVVALTRYVSLAVLVMVSVALVWMLALIIERQLPTEYLAYTLVVAAMTIYRFRGNIQRLLAGTERRLGERA